MGIDRVRKFLLWCTVHQLRDYLDLVFVLHPGA